MQFKILESNKNAPLKRTDMSIEFDNSRSATISKAAIQAAVAAKEKVPVTHVEVRTVNSHRGSTRVVAEVEVYTESKAKDHSVKEAPKTA